MPLGPTQSRKDIIKKICFRICWSAKGLGKNNLICVKIDMRYLIVMVSSSSPNGVLCLLTKHWTLDRRLDLYLVRRSMTNSGHLFDKLLFQTPSYGCQTMTQLGRHIDVQHFTGAGDFGPLKGLFCITRRFFDFYRTSTPRAHYLRPLTDPH